MTELTGERKNTINTQNPRIYLPISQLIKTDLPSQKKNLKKKQTKKAGSQHKLFEYYLLKCKIAATTSTFLPHPGIAFIFFKFLFFKTLFLKSLFFKSFFFKPATS